MELSIAITPSELELVPGSIKKLLINIGHRIMDSDTLYEIAIILKLEHILKQKHFLDYIKTIKSVKIIMHQGLITLICWKAKCLVF